MKYLMTQEEFEEILNDPKPRFTAIYFGATWCGPCKRIDTEALDSMSGVEWLKCDVDQNNYTPGYCSVKAIPSFLVISNGKVTGPIQQSDTVTIIQWVLEEQSKHLKNNMGSQ